MFPFPASSRHPRRILIDSRISCCLPSATRRSPCRAPYSGNAAKPRSAVCCSKRVHRRLERTSDATTHRGRAASIRPLLIRRCHVNELATPATERGGGCAGCGLTGTPRRRHPNITPSPFSTAPAKTVGCTPSNPTTGHAPATHTRREIPLAQCRPPSSHDLAPRQEHPVAAASPRDHLLSIATGRPPLPH